MRLALRTQFFESNDPTINQKFESAAEKVQD